ncbi:uncharacterized protein LOC111716544 [Eurytemora carolleeae]|uniref:uncharacterized protein LOC111716544 n=1 Tax=Eurytemora carolleeae TaxID=1294199 RepID=UPI000C766A00|nr:uncharacterized protein LOC111716544 [Eurytemora carolleeae]|eukprot:XP_023347801.1 uncharacterized protein LOC111716544 [Eurytemora affinis]
MKVLSFIQHLTAINLLQSLEVLQLDTPPYVKVGQGYTMNCYFDLEGESLYSIKWFRDTEEIFSYIATLSDTGVSTVATSVPGVYIESTNVLPESQSTIVFGNSSFLSTGLYQCEVNGDGPRFLSHSDTKKITVAETPSSAPEIQGLPAIFGPGDFLDLNCSIYNTSEPII